MLKFSCSQFIKKVLHGDVFSFVRFISLDLYQSFVNACFYVSGGIVSTYGSSSESEDESKTNMLNKNSTIQAGAGREDHMPGIKNSLKILANQIYVHLLLIFNLKDPNQADSVRKNRKRRSHSHEYQSKIRQVLCTIF